MKTMPLATLALYWKRALALLVCLLAMGLLAELVADQRQVTRLQRDLAEIQHVRYGLLDTDAWMARISGILAKRILEFELSAADRPQLVAAVEQMLDQLFREIEQTLRQRNLASGGNWLDQLQGALQQGLQDVLIDFAELRRRAPQYADLLVEQLNSPQAKAAIRQQLLVLLQRAAETTFARTDRSRLEAILQTQGCTAADHCQTRIQARIDALIPAVQGRLVVLIGLLGLLFFWCLRREPHQPPLGSPRSDRPRGRWRWDLDGFQLAVLTLATLILLAGGILMPMIELQAAISQLSLQLLGEPLTFTDQVLYYQSKSLMEVVRILLQSGAPETVLVGLLLTLFSILVPSLKLIASVLYHSDWHGARARPLVRVFALRSGKWSMADVMVVAIFMAYIGFDALAAHQLASLGAGGVGGASRSLQLITTRGTALAPGFWLFLAFVLSSLVLSSRLEATGAKSLRE